MGAGIAASLLTADERVVLVESDIARAEAASEAVRGSVERLARRDSELDPTDALGRFNAVVGLDQLAGCEIVIEAIPEDLALKRALFAELETVLASDAILASNTSSLSITAMAEGLLHPERLIGSHFFNPVPVSALVELVVGSRTADSVVSSLTGLVHRLGKTPIVIADSPGFASSRLGLVLGLEAIRMLESGVGSADDIDKAMELGYRHPMGPLRLTDLVGLDVRLAIAQHLASELGDRFEPPDLLVQMVANGKLGKKSGNGFYTW